MIVDLSIAGAAAAVIGTLLTLRADLVTKHWRALRHLSARAARRRAQRRTPLADARR